MKNIILVGAIFVLVAAPAYSFAADEAPQADNTAVNTRDARSGSLTPIDQAKGSKQDVELTRRIRQQIVKERNLSQNAMNIKIITLNGVTTLRGPVDTATEKSQVEKIATRVVGASSLVNELEVVSN